MRLKPDELKDALRILSVPDSTVEKMVSQLQDAYAEETRLSNAGLGENHPGCSACAP